MEIQTIKKMQKEALKGSGFDFIRFGTALRSYILYDQRYCTLNVHT